MNRICKLALTNTKRLFINTGDLIGRTTVTA